MSDSLAATLRVGVRGEGGSGLPQLVSYKYEISDDIALGVNS